MKPNFYALWKRVCDEAHFRSLGDGELLSIYLEERHQQRDGTAVGTRAEAAMSVLIARHGLLVYAVCRKRLHCRELARDAFQETFVALVEKGHLLRNREAVSGWLQRTAERVCSNWRRGADRRGQREETVASSCPAVADRPDDALERLEQCRLVGDVLKTLPGEYGEILRLRYLEERSPQEIAVELNRSPRTVYKQIERGEAKFRSAWLKRGLPVTAAEVLIGGRVEALPPGLAAATLRAVARAAAAHGRGIGRWHWMAVGALLTGLTAGGTGLALWKADAPAPTVPEVAAAEVVETPEQQNLRLLREQVVPNLLEALRPLLIGGGELRVLNTSANGTYVRCLLEGRHKVGFVSRLDLRYQTLNGGLHMALDQFGTDNWKQIRLDRPIIYTAPFSRQVAFRPEAVTRVLRCFRIIPLQTPVWLPPQAVSARRLAPVLARGVEDYLGRWYYKGDRSLPPSILYVDEAGSAWWVDESGECSRVKLCPLSDDTITLAIWDNRLRLDVQGRRLIWSNGQTESWWEREES